MTIHIPPSRGAGDALPDFEACGKGSCVRHERCMYEPCLLSRRGADTAPVRDQLVGEIESAAVARVLTAENKATYLEQQLAAAQRQRNEQAAEIERLTELHADALRLAENGQELIDDAGIIMKRAAADIEIRDAVLAQCENALKFHKDILPFVATSIDIGPMFRALDAIDRLKAEGK